MHGDFVWIDLSTFDVARAQNFYNRTLGWDYSEEESGYINCVASGSPSAAIYEMPEFFQKIDMPSFWMAYIAVGDIKAVVGRAKELGGKIELEETNARGSIALIRDPAGAGFTCYEGDALAAQRSFESPGRWCWNELFVSDLSLVRSFYTTLFGWEIEEETSDRFAVRNQSGTRIASIQVASNEEKGDKEFWAVFISVSDLLGARENIEAAGGKIITHLRNSDGNHLLAHDDQGAAFFLTEGKADQVSQSESVQSDPIPGRPKWRSLIGLIGVYLIVLLELDWGWGLLFLFWVIPDLKSGTTYFIEPLSRQANPLLYWAVVLTWLGLSAYLLTVVLL